MSFPSYPFNLLSSLLFVVFDLPCVTIIYLPSTVVPTRPVRRRERSTTALYFILAIRFILAICSL